MTGVELLSIPIVFVGAMLIFLVWERFFKKGPPHDNTWER